jgi:hypothetical protein
MDIREFTADDAETVQAVVELLNSVRKVDAPFAHLVTPAGYVGMIRYGWDGEPPRPFAVRDAGALVRPSVRACSLVKSSSALP